MKKIPAGKSEQIPALYEKISGGISTNSEEFRMDSEASALDSDMDWQAIDIFVFSNGQQYSPPRKYHIRAEDLNLWKSTLSFFAKMQYGP